MKVNYRTALILSVVISLLLNVIFIASFFYQRDNSGPKHGNMQQPPRQQQTAPDRKFQPVDTCTEPSINDIAPQLRADDDSLAQQQPEMRERRHVPEFNFRRTLISLVSNFILSFILYLLNFYLLTAALSDRIKLPVIIGTTIIATLVLSYAISELQIELLNLETSRWRKGFFYMGLNRDCVIALVVVFSSQLIYMSQKQQKTRLENESLQAEYLRSRYEALKNQVDPHFLFNSLNTLNSLIKVDSDKAQEYVQQLSFVFRYTLQNREVITLHEELQFTKAYCHLMQIRYGDNLRFDYRVDEKFYDCLIIPLSIQTLVENAIKHNVVSNKQPLTITIEEYQGAIRVSNPIQLKKEVESGNGIGLANLAERYRLMWKKEIYASGADNVFEVIVPLMSNNA